MTMDPAKQIAPSREANVQSTKIGCVLEVLDGNRMRR